MALSSTAYSDVFKRTEMKYRLDHDQRSILNTAIDQHMVMGEFGETKIASLYYDTPDFALIERSLDKPLYKEKLRLRVYGDPSPLAPSFVELKKKFKGVVYKRRVMLSLHAAQAFFSGMHYEEACRAFPLLDHEAQAQSLSPRSIQIAHEITFAIRRYEDLVPSFLITCARRAYETAEESELRITFDDELACSYEAKSPLQASEPVPLLALGESIMEVKNAGPLPLWLLRALSEAKAYPQSFSKYGHAYMSLKNNWQDRMRKDDECA